jgi:outer membrane lipoprotein SlyB
MRHTAVTAFLFAIITASGCSATTSALGSLVGSKPNQVTVMTSVAPQPVVVNVAPVVIVPQAPSAKHATLAAAATGALAGALLGTVAGYAMDGAHGAGTGAALGAGAGAVTGVVVHETEL